MSKSSSASYSYISTIGSPHSKDLGGMSKNTPKRKRLLPQSNDEGPIKFPSIAPQRSPCRCVKDGDSSFGNDFGKVCNGNVRCSSKLPPKRLSDEFCATPKWNPSDPAQMKAVKEVLHVATAPPNVVCREEEQNRVLEFIKACIQQEKAGSLYVCGCPGTGKTLSINKVKEKLFSWSLEIIFNYLEVLHAVEVLENDNASFANYVRFAWVGLQPLEALTINCTTLTNTSEVFSRILEKFSPCKKTNSSLTSLQHLQSLFSSRSNSNSRTMLLAVIDEMDYLITKDRTLLHDLFMLTTFPFSCLILIGIANAIDLAERFLPKLESLNCKPFVVTFCAYSKDQILKILLQRLQVLGCNVFQPIAIEYCARKVAAASGDMRKVLDACRTAVEVLEGQLRDASTQEKADIVNFDHMDIALSKAFKSSKVDIIQTLPQHQQIILCLMVKRFQHCKRPTTIGELNKSYLEACRSTLVPAVGSLEFTEMCRVLADQGLLKLGQSKDVRSKGVTLQIDVSDILFAFKGIRFFQNILEG